MITGCDFCDFVVYTKKDMFVERIYPDIDFMKSMLKICQRFSKIAQSHSLTKKMHNQLRKHFDLHLSSVCVLVSSKFVFVASAGKSRILESL